MKRLLGLVLPVALVAAGCGKKNEKEKEPDPTLPAAADAAPAPTPADAAVAAPATDPGKRFEECMAAFNARDLDKLRGCYAADAVGALVDSPPELKGPDEILASNQAFWKAFPDFKIEPQLVLVKGKTVAALVLLRGTHQGPLATPGGELPPTGAPIGALGIGLLEYDDAGRAIRERQYLDIGLLMRQLARSAAARPAINSGAAEPVRQAATGTPAEEAARQLAEEQVSAFNQRDWKKLAGLLAPDVVLHDMARAGDLSGAAAVVNAGKALVAAASDARLQVVNAWAAGDHSVVEVEISGTHDGKWLPLATRGTGKPFTLRIARIERIAGGKVAEVWQVSNGVALLQQLGIAPPAVQPAK